MSNLERLKIEARKRNIPFNEKTVTEKELQMLIENYDSEHYHFQEEKEEGEDVKKRNLRKRNRR